MAIENAVAASISDRDTQKRFDRICLYFGVACFLVIHIVAVAFVITKSRTRNQKLAESEKRFRETQQLVDKLAKEREQKLTQEQAKDHETRNRNKITLVEVSRPQGGS